MDRAQLLTQKVLKQGCGAPTLKSSLQKVYGRHHDLVDHYEISISQITMDLTFYVDFYSLLYHCQDFYQTGKKQEVLTLRDHMNSHPVCW